MSTQGPAPFAPHTAIAAVDDPRAPALAARWVDVQQDAGVGPGTNVHRLRDVAPYRSGASKWQAQKTAVARMLRLRMQVGGLGLHDVQARSVAPARPAMRLVPFHGRPHSIGAHHAYAAILRARTGPPRGGRLAPFEEPGRDVQELRNLTSPCSSPATAA